MKITRLLLVVTVLLVFACAATNAAITSEDMSYWLNDGSVLWNPSTAELNSVADKLVLKVQQTVYDNSWTRNITGLDTDGFLYAYAVTNLTYQPSEGRGLVLFEVKWDVDPIYVAVSPQSVDGWTASVAGGSPVLKWEASGPGLMPASSVTYWAVSPISSDTIVPAQAAGTADPGMDYPYLVGQTTGPNIPEPSTIVGLASAMAGLGISTLRRKRF